MELTDLPGCPPELLASLEARSAEVERFTDHAPRYHVRLRSPAGPLFAWYARDQRASAVLAHELAVRAVLGRSGPVRGPVVVEHGDRWRLEPVVVSEPRTGRGAIEAMVDASLRIASMTLPAAPGPALRRGRSRRAARRIERLARLGLSPLPLRDVLLARRLLQRSALPRVTSHGGYHPAHIFLAQGAVWVIDWEQLGSRPLGLDLMQLWSALDDPGDREAVFALALDAIGVPRRQALAELRYAALIARIVSKLAEQQEFGDRDPLAARTLLVLLPEARAAVSA
jgi:Phosphotransferase enzyme family